MANLENMVDDLKDSLSDMSLNREQEEQFRIMKQVVAVVDELVTSVRQDDTQVRPIVQNSEASVGESVEIEAVVANGHGAQDRITDKDEITFKITEGDGEFSNGGQSVTVPFENMDEIEDIPVDNRAIAEVTGNSQGRVIVCFEDPDDELVCSKSAEINFS